MAKGGQMVDTGARRVALARGQPLGLPPVIVPERVHDRMHVLLWQARGATDCELDGVRRELLVGHALWLPAKVVHRLHVRADSVVLPMHFDIHIATGMPCVPTWIAVDGALRTLLLALLQVRHSIIQPEADVERRVLRMLLRAVPPTGLAMPRLSGAYDIAEHLRDHQADGRSVVELAAEQHLSVRTIERAFLADTGIPLREWRLRRRMEVANAMLQGSAEVDEVAAAVGYCSVAAFRRVFKARVGLTPSEFARRFRLSR